MLWYQRVVHIGEKRLRELHGKSMVEGMFDLSLYLDLCEHCIYGKQNQVRFPSGSTREKETL